MSPQWTATPWPWKERGGKGTLVPGIGWLCGGGGEGGARGPGIPTNEITTMSVKLPYILHWPAQPVFSHSVQLICTSYVT